MILQEAQLSKGALYHHFSSKEEICAALYEETSRAAIAAAIASIAKAPTHLDALELAARAWLCEIRNPDIGKFLLVIGPPALGLARAKEIEDANSLAALITHLRAAKKSGEISITSIEITARLLNAQLAEAAFLYRQYGDECNDDIDDMLHRFFESLK